MNEQAAVRGIALEARAVGVSFNGFHAVDGVDLVVRDHSVHAVIGPNGAGKSTLFNLITGFLRPTSGRVLLRGTDITGRDPAQVARMGLGRAFQITNIFPHFTVQESLELAVNAQQRRMLHLLPSHPPMVRQEVDRVLEIVGLAEHRDRLAKELSHGDQRALEVSLALALRPDVLLLDEPTAGMAPSETGRITSLIRDLVDRADVTVLFCEHDVPMVFGVSDFITVMHQGAVLVEGTPDEIRGNDEVREVYLGAEA